MDARILADINVLVTRRNLAMRKLITGTSGEVNRQLQTFIIGADARARALGARLVPMPGRLGAVIPDVFLSIVTD